MTPNRTQEPVRQKVTVTCCTNEAESVDKIAQHELMAHGTDNANISDEVRSIRARQEEVTLSNLVPCIRTQTKR